MTAIASKTDHAASDKAFAWLRAICTNPDYGVFRKSGLYPPGTSSRDLASSSKLVHLGLESVEFYDKWDSINVRNSILLSWVQTLRAHSIERERELLILCFASAPELVAAYFSQKVMQLDPKLTNTWIGFASLLFEVVTLPVPARFGNEEEVPSLPPQTSIIIESILPRPLTQTVLTRCLNQSSELITFFAVRILIKAFEKLAIVTRQLRTSSATEQESWDEATQRLQERFIARCPPMKDVIAVFRKLPDDDDHAMQREATTRLLSLYYEVIPVQALEEQFDVSAALATALSRSGDGTPDDPELQRFRGLELEHLLHIARHGTNMRWFNKQGNLAVSPSVALLQIHRKDVSNKNMRLLLGHILQENGILNGQGERETSSPLEALVASTMDLPDNSSVWSLVEDCFTRCVRQPVKYVDLLEALMPKSGMTEQEKSSRLPSLLTAVILEQTPFVAAQSDAAGQEKQTWIALLLDLLAHTSDDDNKLQQVSAQTKKVLGMKKSKKSENTTAEALLRSVVIEEHTNDTSVLEEASTEKDNAADLNYQPPPAESDSHPELLRWTHKDIDIAIEDRDIDAVILCLCSQHSSIRKQAATQLNKLKFQLRSANDQENGPQLTLLVGEVLETFEQQYAQSDLPMPYIAGTFATRALHVQTQPHHFLYPKINHFLIRGPEWRASKLPSYWLSNTLLDQPKIDDSYWREVQWVLNWLVDGLRSPSDLEILRRGSIFEKILGLWSSPGAANHRPVKEKSLELVFRATCVEGGSDFLITRVGILDWLEMISEPRADGLKKRILESCDTERIGAWKGVVAG